MKTLRSFEEITKDCINSKGTSTFENKFYEFINCQEMQKLILDFCKQYGKNKITIKNCIENVIKEHGFRTTPSFDSLKRYFQDEIKTESNEIDELQKMLGLLEEIKVDDRRRIILLGVFSIAGEERVESLNDLIYKLEKKRIDIDVSKDKSYIQKSLMQCSKYSVAEKFEVFHNKLKNLFIYNDYIKIAEYIMQQSESKSKDKKPRPKMGNKVKIPELIINFNKMRNYLSLLLLNDDIRNKTSLIQKCPLESASSYEKEIRRITSLFREDNDISTLGEKLKKYSPNKIAKIYDIHNVPNLVSNLLFLDILQKYESGIIKLDTIASEVFSKDTSNMVHFKKYIILPRLKQLSKYGFVTIKNKGYSVNIKFLSDTQINILKKVVPHYYGKYPFVSIAHFIVKRLEIPDDNFEYKSYNVSNILDESIAYDLMEAINNNKKIKISFKDRKDRLGNKNKGREITPKGIVVDEKKHLFKVIDDKNKEYYLNEIDEINNTKPNNLIFSEIYSFYYQILEKSIEKYKENKKNKLNKIIEKLKNKEGLEVEKINNLYSDKNDSDLNEILKNYGSIETPIYKKQIKNLLELLSSLNKVSIPLTELELRWLKTIMQDEDFDSFVSNEEKASLEELVNETKPFDFSPFKNFKFV